MGVFTLLWVPSLIPPENFKGLFESMQRFPDCWKVTEVEMFWSEMFEMCIGLMHALTDQ